MKPSLSLETTWGSALRAFCLGLVLLGFLPSLRAEQFGLFTYQVFNGTTVSITGYPTNATGPVEIPAEIAGKPVTSIEYSAFSGCTGLTSATIPNSVTSIGSGAFSGCTRLTHVTISEGITRIPEAAFSGCSALTSVIIPEGVTDIGIQDWDTVGAFSGCTGLTNISLPSSLNNIGVGTFFDCTGLTAINVEAGNPTYASESGVLLNAARTGIILCPQGKTGSYSIPSSVTAIGDWTFQDRTGLTSVTIPSSVTAIGEYAFSGCNGLTNVTLEQGFTKIGSSMFAGCTGLTSITIPASVTAIGEYAFSGCTRLGSFVVAPGNTVYSSAEGALLNAAQTTLVLFPQGKAGHYGIPSSVTSIGVGAFAGSTELTSVTLPEGLTTIEGFAFSGCTGLTSVTIPSSVTHIGKFYYIWWNIYAQAFSRCTALTRAVFLGNAPAIAVGDAYWSPLGREFEGAAPGFTIYHLSSRQGFTSPTWNGYPATRIDEAAYPAAAWLLKHGLWYDSDLRQDPDGDGVNLLTAYALNLDPRLNLRGRLPAPVLGANTLSLNFHASSPGITYRVETSTNLTYWTTTGVTQSAPGADGRSTASVLRDAPHRFLRLMVQD